MQDSLEDYVRISKNNKQNVMPATKEAVLTDEKRQQCNTRALKIVEFSIEGKLHPQIFLRCLPYINQSHYQDIVEERAISKICGYPVCGRKLPQMPKKQYHISTKQNKVYDITERKNYCSNFCYKAGIHIKTQIDTSPLWLRRLEDTPKFKLLPPTDSGLPGEEIDQGIAKPVAEPSFTSINSFAGISLDDVIDDEIGVESHQNTTKSITKKSCLSEKLMETINEITDSENIQPKQMNRNNDPKKENISTRTNVVDGLPGETACENRVVLENSGDNIPCESKSKVKSKKSSKKKVPKTPLIPLDVESHMKRCLKEWFTLETHIYLFGDDKIKERISEDRLVEIFNNREKTQNQLIYRKRYMELCRSINLKDLADEKLDKKLLGNIKLQPLPDYEKLKEESKAMNLKVKSFYGGLSYETGDHSSASNNTKKEEGEDGPPAVLPLVDTKAKIALRRKIFLTSAKKAMETLLQKLRISPLATISDLQALVKTFDLKADNIVFKPHIWNYISLALLKILSLKDGDISEALEAEKVALQYVDTLLSDLPSKIEFINYAVDLVKDSDHLIEKYLALGES